MGKSGTVTHEGRPNPLPKHGNKVGVSPPGGGKPSENRDHMKMQGSGRFPGNGALHPVTSDGNSKPSDGTSKPFPTVRTRIAGKHDTRSPNTR